MCHVAALALACALFAMPAAAQPLSLGAVGDRHAVSETVTLVAHHADAHAWTALRALYADTVALDYTSLNGGEPATVDADAMIAGWRGLLPGFTLTHHHLGPVVVTLDGDLATAEAHLRATHRIDGVPDGETWVVGGHYRYRLRREPSAPLGWAITDHALLGAFQEGNRSLPTLAAERAASAPR